MAKQLEMNKTAMKALLWTGPILILGMIVAQGFLMHFFPPPDPDLSAEEITKKFQDRKTEIRLGAIIMAITWSFWVTWGIPVTVFLRKMERGYPALTYASIALLGGGYVITLLIPTTWAVAAFRPDTMDPQIIQAINDWVWFLWLFTWPPFAVWMVVVGVAIFKDHNVPAYYPRWMGYMSIWCAVLIAPAGLIVFFKDGLFAWNGVGAFWVPVVPFFLWISLTVFYTFKAINREDAVLTQRLSESSESPESEQRIPVAGA